MIRDTRQSETIRESRVWCPRGPDARPAKPPALCIIHACPEAALPGDVLCEVHRVYFRGRCRWCGAELPQSAAYDRGLCSDCWRRLPDFAARCQRFDAAVSRWIRDPRPVGETLLGWSVSGWQPGLRAARRAESRTIGRRSAANGARTRAPKRPSRLMPTNRRTR